MTLFVEMLGLGLVTSLHCVAMCGGLVLMCAVGGPADAPWQRRLTPHLAYQGAKIASYAAVALALGGLVALVGHTVDIAGLRNWLLVVAGVYMVALGLGMTGRFRVLAHLQPRPPKALVRAISRVRRRGREAADEGDVRFAVPVGLGLLTGLMPCAPLIAAQAAAVSSGSPLTAAFAMAGFGLGTAPLMLALGFGSSLLTATFRKRMQIVAALAVVVFGFVIFDRGLMLVGSPITFSSVVAAVSGGRPATSPEGFAVGADGVVEVQLAIRDTAYVPDTVVVPAGVKVRLVVDRQEDVACSDQLAVPSAKLLVDLKANGITRVELPPMAAGSYTLTCGMGMMSGKIVAIAAK